MSSRVEITVLSGPSSGDIFKFDVDRTKGVTIGRAPDNDLVLQDPSVSRKHAVIGPHEGSLRLMDLGSTHGTVHMGFPVNAGAEGARILTNGDEFKVGDALFRVNFDESATPAAKPSEDGKNTDRGSTPPQPKKSKKTLVIALLLVLCLVGFLMMPQGKKKSKQLSHKVISLPQERVIGYMRDGSSKLERDKRHKEMAQFSLPPADVLVEFDYKSEAIVEVFVDEALLHTLDPHIDVWQPWAFVIRDPQIGRDRKLVFKNKSFNKKNGKSMKWAVRNVRATPISRHEKEELTQQLQEAAAFAETIDQTSSSLSELIRSLQVAILESINELSLDGYAYGVFLEAPFPSPDEVEQELNGIIAERTGPATEFDAEANNRHLRVLSGLTSKLDAELWRRVNNRLNRARLASSAKNWIVAHDALVAVKRMFPDESDLRWTIANRMLNDKKIVPKKVLQDPGRYRR